jgi:predicted transcriptional regulator YheO
MTHETFEDAAEVLRTFRPVMRAIAAAGGPTCEVVLHNLDGADIDLGHTIMAIENGHVTGREVGGPSTSLGLDVLQNRRGDHDAFGYRGFTGDGGSCAARPCTSATRQATSSRRCASTST